MNSYFRFFTSLLFSLVSLVISLGLVEAGFRLWKARAASTVAWNDRPPFYFQAEASPTLKDYAYAPTKPENTFRIAVVGDSYSFAPYMQFTDAFPKVLERMLNLNDVPTRAEVINFGVPGYSTTHEIEEVGTALKMQSDLVILQITLNDPELKPYRPTGIREFGRFGAYEPGGWLGAASTYWQSLRFVLERLHNNHTAREYERYFLELFENGRSRKVFEDALRQIRDRCVAANVPLVAFIFPLFGLPLDDSYPFHPIHRQVSELLSKEGIPHDDLFERYRGIPLERLQVIPGRDRHPNEIAHRMAAEHLYEFLTASKFIPPEFHIRRKFQGRTQIIKERPYEPVSSE
jgi:lysophospholipase L1-like esterase